MPSQLFDKSCLEPCQRVLAAEAELVSCWLTLRRVGCENQVQCRHVVFVAIVKSSPRDARLDRGPQPVTDWEHGLSGGELHEADKGFGA